MRWRAEVSRSQDPRHLRPLQHHQRTGTPRGRGSAGRLSGAAGTGDAPWARAPGQPAHRAAPPPRATHHRVRARGEAIGRDGAGHETSPSRNVSANGSATCVTRWRVPSRQETTDERPLHGRLAADERFVAALARRDLNSLRVFHRNTPATPPHRAAHTATGGASGRNRSRSPGMVADVGLNGARRRPSRN